MYIRALELTPCKIETLCPLISNPHYPLQKPLKTTLLLSDSVFDYFWYLI